MRTVKEFERRNFLALICAIFLVAVLIAVVPAIAFAQVRCHVDDFDESCSYADTLLGWYRYAMEPVDTIVSGDTVILYPMLCEFGGYYAPQDSLAKITKTKIESTPALSVGDMYHFPNKGTYKIIVKCHVKKDNSRIRLRYGDKVAGIWEFEANLHHWDRDSCENIDWDTTISVEETKSVLLEVESAVEFRPGTDEDFCIEYISDIPTLTEWGLIIFGVVLLGFITYVFLRRRKAVVSLR